MKNVKKERKMLLVMKNSLLCSYFIVSLRTTGKFVMNPQ